MKLQNIVGIKTKNNVYSYFEEHHVVYLHKGRTAIRLACELLGLAPDNEILAPSYNCGSEIDALLSSGVLVKLYRIDRSAKIDINDLESKITSKTKALYVTHYFGFPQSVEIIKSICEKYDLYLIEDCALTLFSRHDEKMIGTTGDIAIFSLPKTLPVPDGGILLINNEVLREKSFSLLKPRWPDIFIATLPLLKAALIRWLSINPPFNPLYTIYEYTRKLSYKDNEQIVQKRPDIPQSYYYDNKYTNKNISSLTQRLIKTFEPTEIREKRRRNFKALSAEFAPYSDVTPLYNELPDHVCPLYFPLLVEKRDAMAKKLNQKQIDARAWWRGFHSMLPWSQFPDAAYLKDTVLALPVHEDLSEAAIDYTAKCVKDFTCERLKSM